MGFFVDNLGTIVIALVLFIILFFIIKKIIKDLYSGNSFCGCACDSCGKCSKSKNKLSNGVTDEFSEKTRK